MSPVEVLGDHTYRMVLLGTVSIGVVAGALGSFAYLRKQSLISDVVAHAALPGTLGAFLVAVVLLGVDGRNMGGLLVGAIIVGTAAVLLSNRIAATSRIRIDTAMAVVLCLFFGVGMMLMRHITDGDYPGKGGIQDYLFGNASVITRADLATSLAVGGVALAVMLVLWKEFALRTFDPDHATVSGIDPRVVDTAMFGAIVIATVIGVKSVGLVLMVAFVVTPPAAARQWTHTLRGMVTLSGVIGGLGSGVGAYLSIALGGAPTGPLIVLTLFAILVVSLLAAPGRSVVVRAISRSRARSRLLAELRAEAER